jgi:hypothetical protein
MRIYTAEEIWRRPPIKKRVRFIEGNWRLGRMVLALKAGCTMILTVSLQFAKHVFGVRPFSNLQNNTVIRLSFTLFLYVQVAIFP